MENWGNGGGDIFFHIFFILLKKISFRFFKMIQIGQTHPSLCASLIPLKTLIMDEVINKLGL